MAHKKGIIGFFDILGYKNFLENNEVGEAVSEVLKTLAEMPIAAQAYVKKTVNSTQDSGPLPQTEHLVFSDTILLTSGYDEEESKERKELRWILFLFQTAVLTRKMFDYGLPLRGAITFGEYVVQTKGSCFAGRPIIEAYNSASGINVSAVILSKSADEEMSELSVDGDVKIAMEQWLVSYLVPMKAASPIRSKIIDFTVFKEPTFKSLDRDVRSLVFDCFSSHSKDVPPSVYEKLNNTEMLLRFLLKR